MAAARGRSMQRKGNKLPGEAISEYQRQVMLSIYKLYLTEREREKERAKEVAREESKCERARAS